MSDKVTPSTNPITIKINEWIFERYLNEFMAKYLPIYTWRKTSGYRDKEHNDEIGGAKDSAHLYGLAQDGNLINNSTGKIIGDDIGAKIFNDYFVKHWEGYAKFYPTTASSRWHIHINIDRDITKYTKMAGVISIMIGVGIAVKTIHKKLKA